ncbi:hypothetical protein PSTG_04962 [Puccinia striiformis f. sp. tritici PST-78]|nr:hypothetical protein PSTG_04962 [Puccinia striiformis f. sp. tritici PST-78]
MKRFIITLVLCWTAFASLLGAMNVMREGTEVKPAIVEEAAPAVEDEPDPEICQYCQGNGCRFCGE